MVDVAVQATNGMKIPGQKSTWAEIKWTFKEHLTKLKAQLNIQIYFRQLVPHSHIVQGPTITGEVNLTYDTWQASNMDGYFTVTGHWIEETTPTQRELKSGLLGFTQLSNAHNSEQLGQALYKIIKQVSIAHKVG
jgi:hypothetical protein